MLRSILRDRHFTIQCDNRGLTFLRTDSKPMVYRWLVDTQEYDYAIEDILGVNNPVKIDTRPLNSVNFLVVFSFGESFCEDGFVSFSFLFLLRLDDMIFAFY
jgi:hypothetical protein